jgi:hypothetical protein
MPTHEMQEPAARRVAESPPMAPFEPIEWVAIAWIAAATDPLAARSRIRSLCAIEASAAATDRIEALADMAVMVRCFGARRFEQRLRDFHCAGFSQQQLDLLVESMARAQERSSASRI